MKSLLLCLVALLAVGSWWSVPGSAQAALRTAGPAVPGQDQDRGPSGTCGTCHAGIEEMHPWKPLGCAECHGGDDTATTKERAHVGSRSQLPNDERVLSAGFDRALVRFLNPSDLRVADATCGACHAETVERVKKSLHATTAGHLCDGLFENGILARKGSPYGIFAVSDDEVYSEHGQRSLKAFPMPLGGESDELSTHFKDLGRKACMRCHLWSAGTAVRGRLGQDGDYRGTGCAACHVVYGEDGLSRSNDPTVDRFEPGHPQAHRMVTNPPTETCVSCHYGDASIGMHFRGLAQLVPGMPAGPDVPGTTDRPLNGAFYIRDPQLTPPDVHFERGMHCVDCHTGNDLMGDGEIYGAMEHAIEIECSDCHGTFEEASRLTTSRGAPLKHLRREGREVVLTSRVTGSEHFVPQVVHVVDPKSPRYNPQAAKAMNPMHGRLECYACHTAWNANFFGFHFDRNEAFTQLDLLSGARTTGRVTTQEKVFATLKEFRLGWNSEGRIAPYMVGFSSMGSVHDANGDMILRQELPATANELSGMTMVHHQVHAVRPAARSCVECHRSATTWGLGSPNYRLARDLLFSVGDEGLVVHALDPRAPAGGLPLARLALPGARRSVLRSDAVHGRADRLFAAAPARLATGGGRSAGGSLYVVDVADPLEPRLLQTLEGFDPQAVVLAGEILLLADGEGGLKLLRERGERWEVIGAVATVDARDVAVHGKLALVADGAGGLAIVDWSEPERPFVVSALHLGENEQVPDDAASVAVLWQGSRPRPAERARTPARLLVALADRQLGLVLVDATDPERPRRFATPEGARTQSRGGATQVLLGSHWDLGDAQGQIPTEENDYAYVLDARGELQVVRVTRPDRPRSVGRLRLPDNSARGLATLHVYNPPFLVDYLVVAGAPGLSVVNLAKSSDPQLVGTLEFAAGTYGVAVEEFALDRMIDEQARPLKDISHEGARFLSRSELNRVLSVPAAVLGLDTREVGYRLQTIPPEDFGALPRTMLSKLDRDRSGVIEGRELQTNKAVAAQDHDGDGAVTLHELLYGGQRRETRSAEGMQGRPEGMDPAVLERRQLWAELLRDRDVAAFDRDGDGYLSPQGELRELLHAVFDLDGDGEVDAHELARVPGAEAPPRRGERPKGGPLGLDRNKDGRLNAREVDPERMGAGALDLDGDGRIALREVPPLGSDRAPEPRPMVTDPLRLLAKLDRDGDGALSDREMPPTLQPYLAPGQDENGDGKLDERELLAVVARARDNGLLGVSPRGIARFDLDGDGRLDAAEFPGPAWIFRRLDRDGDGYLGAARRR